MVGSAVRERVSWVDVPADSDFTLYNLPYGVFSTPDAPGNVRPRCGVAIGDLVLDLASVAHLMQCVDGLDSACFSKPALNDFMAHDAPVWAATRSRITALLELGPEGCGDLRDNAALRARALVPQKSVRMHLPAHIGDYTDFYASREHAYNCGCMFRSPENALQPNWLHLPVGYHGRSSSVFVSGTPVIRPQGQLQLDKSDPSKGSVMGATKLLDFECEMGVFLGGAANTMGTPITMENAPSRIFGLVLLNDWSARDIQAWEYVPLGPFVSKNFSTSISPWVVPYEALEVFTCETSALSQDPLPLDYLRDPQYSSFDIELTVDLQGADMLQPARVSTTNMKNLYWNIRQQLVHHSITGCVMRAGDLLGTGTISGSTDDALGSMLELSWRGTRQVTLGTSGQVRKFLQDQDQVTMQGRCSKTIAGTHISLGFGSVRNTILPANSLPPPLLPTEPVLSAVPGGAGGRYVGWKLYGFWRSSCSWRVRLALAAKAIEYEYVPVNLRAGLHSAAPYASVNPMQQVPTLEFLDTDTGETVCLSQSMAIMVFLESAFPTSGLPLLGGGGLITNARVLEMSELINSGIQPLQNMSTLTRVTVATAETNGHLERREREREKEREHEREEKWASHFIARGLEALEEKHVLLKNRNASANCVYTAGTPEATIADFMLLPQLYNARRWNVAVEDVCPELLKVELMLNAQPWIVACHVDLLPDAVP